jgi:hypothetical protein
MYKRSVSMPEKLHDRIAALQKRAPHYSENALMVEAMVRGLPSLEREMEPAKAGAR